MDILQVEKDIDNKSGLSNQLLYQSKLQKYDWKHKIISLGNCYHNGFI